MTQPVSESGVRFPLPGDAFLVTLRALLAARNETIAAEVLTTGRSSIVHRGWDNWDGGQDYWGIDVALPVRTYAKTTETSRNAIETKIQDAMAELLRGHETDHASSVIIKPAIGTDLTLVKTDITNQGSGVFGKPAHIEHDGLRFRSHAEVRLFKALRSLNVLVAPLPVFVSGQLRREPDFFIVKDGDMMLVEVDGPETHPERAVAAERRLAPFKDEGVRVERVSTAECDGDADAEKCAQRLVAKFDRYRNHR